MDNEPKAMGFTELQGELYEATGLVFDVAVTDEGVDLSLEGVHVLGMPAEAAQTPVESVRAFKFPRNLKPGMTLVQRRALIKTLSGQTSIRIGLQSLLAEVSDDAGDKMQRILTLERMTRDELCLLIWDLDDLTIGRLAEKLSL